MAERRMFAKSIVMSDAFLDMPASARCLYFTLGMFADDDGFVNSPKSIMRQSGASLDDMNVLIAKKFVYTFDDGVIVIKHWRINNLLRQDRRHATNYTDDLKQLSIDENGAYTLCQPIDNQLTTNCQPNADNIGYPSIGKVSIGKDSIGKGSLGKTDPPTVGEILSNSIPAELTVEKYIKEKGYKINAHRFYTYYTSDGRVFPTNWKAVIDKWESTEYKKTPKRQKFTKVDPASVTKDTFGCEYLFEDNG